MLKVRLIPTIVLKGDALVQSHGFKRYLPIGKIDAAIEFFNNWDVDEIVIIDIDASKENRDLRLDIIEKAAKNCFVPLTIGGGVKKTSQVRDLLNVGADKVCINTTAHTNPQFISEVAGIYGSQFITVSVDSKKVDGVDKAFALSGTLDTGIKTTDFVKRCVELGAGEIILHSIDRDGSKAGYDLDLLKTVRGMIKVPLIASGGVGRFQHLVDAVKVAGCNGVAAGNIFQHTELSTIAAKSFMKRAGIPIRIDSNVKYENYQFDLWDRPI